MSAPMTDPIRFSVLDSWRGLCALLVALMHLSTQFLYLPISETAIVGQFFLFVDFFFVLSGFVIAHAYQGKLRTTDDIARFSIRRIGRLWPLHVALFAVMFILEIMKALLSAELISPEGWDFPDAVANLLLLHGLGIVPKPNINGPSWSISAELWVNLLFGFVLVVSRQWMIQILGIVAVASALVLILFTDGRYLDVTTDLGLFRCLYGFAIGVFIYRLWSLRLCVPWIGLTELPVLVLIGLYLPFSTWPPLTLAAPLLFALTIFVFAHEGGLVSKIMRSGPLLRIGLWSYSIYLVHYPLFTLLSRVAGLADQSGNEQGLKADHVLAGEGVSLITFDSPATQGLVALAVLVSVVLASALTHAMIEVPGRRFFNSLSASGFRDNRPDHGRRSVDRI